MATWIFLDAAAQSTVPGTITNVATTIVLASSAAFGNPSAGQQIGLIILDSGNVAWNANNPLATPYEYVYETGNVVGTNTITVTRARAGTTAKTFSAGATIAAVLLAEALAADGTGAFLRADTTQVAAASNVPNGTLGYAEATANQGSITTVVDLTSVTTTVTVGTGRRIKVTAMAPFTSTILSDAVQINICEDGAVIESTNAGLDINYGHKALVAFAIRTPAGGSHTYKVQAVRSGTGTVTMEATATNKAFVLVEDIGV